MSARPTWKGVLKISLVTIPIKVFPATESSSGLSLNQLHQECTTRIQQKKWCPTCEREVPTAEIVKGFEFEKGKYVLLLEAELDAVQPPSMKVIELTQFADAAELEPRHIDRSYYLAPEGEPAAAAYGVLCTAMRDRVGVGKLAIYGREYLVAVRSSVVRHSLQPGDTNYTYRRVLMLHTLHHAAELRPVDEIDGLQEQPRAMPGEVRLAQQMIAAFTGPLDLTDFHDEYKADLQRLIDAKVAGQEIVVPPVETPGAVLNLKAALELSLESMKKKIPAKAAAPAKRKQAS